MKTEPEAGSDGHEAARLLVKYLRHIEIAREKRHANEREKIVLVLPDTEVAERTRKAVAPARVGSGKKKRA